VQTNDRPNIQTYALCTFTFSLQTCTIFFRINAFINVYYNYLTFITSMRIAAQCYIAISVICQIMDLSILTFTEGWKCQTRCCSSFWYAFLAT